MKQISLLLKLFKSTNADGSPNILLISHFENNNGSSAEHISKADSIHYIR